MRKEEVREPVFVYAGAPLYGDEAEQMRKLLEWENIRLEEMRKEMVQQKMQGIYSRR